MSSRRAAWTLALVAVVSVSIAGQSPTPRRPGPEHQKLAVFLGKWRFEGQSQASPYGPAGKLTSTDTYDWVTGGFFLVHHWDGTQGGAPNKGVEIVGYDVATKAYVSRFFDNMGNSGVIRFTVNGDTWTGTAESDVAGRPLKERGSITLTGDTMTARWEYSTDGSKWATSFESKGTRVK